LAASRNKELKVKLTKAEQKFMAKLAARGGRARAKVLSPKQRHEIAIRAAVSRWARVKAAQAEQAQVLQ
jgi:hypothetical protein